MTGCSVEQSVLQDSCAKTALDIWMPTPSGIFSSKNVTWDALSSNVATLSSHHGSTVPQQYLCRIETSKADTAWVEGTV
jgi:hypothetical protein